MEGSAIRALVVDDYGPWRRFAITTLGKKPELRVVGEATDGLEAIRMAQLLQPDLVVLDIGLPKLNGPEAARRIRELSPKSKILFLSENRSLDIAKAALGAGGIGYVVKSDAASELLPAVEAVLHNQQFLSSAVRGAGFTDVSAAEGRRSRKPFTSPADMKHWGIAPGHEVVFYSEDEGFLNACTLFVEGALVDGSAVLVALSDPHRIRLLAELRAKGLDMDLAIREGRYTSLDPAETLSAFMVDDLPDADRFFEAIGKVITVAARAAKGEQPRVAACAECGPHLWIQGKANAAIQLEKLCNRLIKTYHLDILCGYALSSFEAENDNEVFEQLCAEHSAVYSQ